MRAADVYVETFGVPSHSGWGAVRMLVLRLGKRRWFLPLNRRPTCWECRYMERNCSLHVGASRD